MWTQKSRGFFGRNNSPSWNITMMFRSVPQLHDVHEVPTVGFLLQSQAMVKNTECPGERAKHFLFFFWGGRGQRRKVEGKTSWDFEVERKTLFFSCGTWGNLCVCVFFFLGYKWFAWKSTIIGRFPKNGQPFHEVSLIWKTSECSESLLGQRAQRLKWNLSKMQSSSVKLQYRLSDQLNSCKKYAQSTFFLTCLETMLFCPKKH